MNKENVFMVCANMSPNFSPSLKISNSNIEHEKLENLNLDFFLRSTFSTRSFPWENNLVTGLFLRVFHIFASFLKHLAMQAQTVLLVKYAIFLHSFVLTPWLLLG